MLLTLAFLMMFLAGCFQSLYWLIVLGSLVKYAPAPVIAGFQNAAAILIFCSQFDSMFGFNKPVAVLSSPANLGMVQPLTLLVGVVTCVVILLGARIAKAIPPTLLGLITGGVLYYLFVLLGWGGHLGQLVGKIPVALPTPHFLAKFKAVFMIPPIPQALPLLRRDAARLAIIACTDWR